MYPTIVKVFFSSLLFHSLLMFSAGTQRKYSSAFIFLVACFTALFHAIIFFGIHALMEALSASRFTIFTSTW